MFIHCADTHILIDENNVEVFAVDSLDRFIQTIDGPSKVLNVVKTDIVENMYDLELHEGSGHIYYSNGILSHNTISTAAYIVWYVIFMEHKTVGILAHQAGGAREILDRVQMIYQDLPLWLQAGVTGWSKSKIGLDNGCKILTAATSSPSIRGKSLDFLYLDEIAWVGDNEFDRFYASVYPTLAAKIDSKLVMSSTPNGLNHFYKFWKEAVDGTTVFDHFEINWWDVPARDEKFKLKTIAEIGQDRWEQEFECVGKDELIEVCNNDTGEIFILSIGEFYEWCV
jgi:hypothetical protein